MTPFAVIRHLPTSWNETGRLQGRRDVPLTADPPCLGRLPRELDGFRWLSSPLRRAVETALALGIAEPGIEPRLVEMSWGQWEGMSLAELRARLGPQMAAVESRGLDFRAPGGESPRDVQARLAPLLAELADRGEPTGAVTHKGVIRAILALASGWDMQGKPPCRLRWDAVHLFHLDSRGRPAVERLNLAVTPR